MSSHKPNNENKIGLNMIVKDESHVIEQLLRSVAPYIDTYTIVDTGSSDNTPQVITDVMNQLGIKGNLHHRPWKNFGANRTEALELARGTAKYHWVIDADDLIVGQICFPKLDSPSYFMKYGRDFKYKRQQIFRDDLPWQYIGVLHEYASCGKQVQIGSIEGDYYIESRRLGARNKNPRKYLDDAQVLKSALEQEPDNKRYWFYLGQSYYDAAEYQLAKDAYFTRSQMQGWDEETFYAKYRFAICKEVLDAPVDELITAHTEAFRFRPTRAEPLYRLALLLREKKQYDLSVLYSRHALTLPFPSDILFVDSDVYSYKVKDEFSVAAYYCSNAAIRLEGYKVCLELIRRVDIPTAVSDRAASNLEWYDKKYPQLSEMI
jgi:glycosyltransferase involved in cell wall biosynthesis